jgi:hypothetical protein
MYFLMDYCFIFVDLISNCKHIYYENVIENGLLQFLR